MYGESSVANEAAGTLRYRIADVDIAVEAPQELLRIVAESYRRFPQPKFGGGAHTIVSTMAHEDGTLSIQIRDREYVRVSAAAGRGLIGLQISNAIITAVSECSRFLVMHAATLERNGEATCIAGRGLAGKTLLATHLVSRGWRILSDEYAFIEPMSGHVVPFPKMLYVRSSSLPHMPRTFRKSVESSPWYGLGDHPGIVFTGVDPTKRYSERVWSSGARLKNVIILTARDERGALIEECDPWSIVPELNALVWQPPNLLDGLTRLANALRGVRVARLTAGGPLQTANAIERWTGSAVKAPLFESV